ncbi:hypothetical protein A616_16630 [Brevibacillus brevis X23]|nr:hypothetical protein A616_16630 [Brevibacillus brevis X23]
MEIEIKAGQTWISEEHPEQSIVITGGTVIDDKIKWEWYRADKNAFYQFVELKKGRELDYNNGDSTYPYAYYGYTDTYRIRNKIQAYIMVLR